MAKVEASYKVRIQLEDSGTLIHEGALAFSPRLHDTIRFTVLAGAETLYKVESVETNIDEYWVPAQQNSVGHTRAAVTRIIVDVSIVP